MTALMISVAVIAIRVGLPDVIYEAEAVGVEEGSHRARGERETE